MERGIGDMSTSRKHPAPRPMAVVAWDDHDDAARAAIGDEEAIAKMHLLAEACDMVDPIPSRIEDDTVTWRSPGITRQPVEITLYAPRHRIHGWIVADVHVDGADRTRRRLGATTDPLGPVMILRTRIPFGSLMPEYASERTIPLLGAYARACAAALDGSLTPMEEQDLDLAISPFMRTAYTAFVATEGNDPNGIWSTASQDVLLRCGGETPLEPGSVRMSLGRHEAVLDRTGIPPFATMTVDDQGVIVLKRAERLASLWHDPTARDPMRTLRAVERLGWGMEEPSGETSGKSGA